jgi:hypothetical protein
MTTTYTQCPSCGSLFPIGSQHDCPTHIRFQKSSGKDTP